MVQETQANGAGMPGRFRPTEECRLLTLETVSRLGPVTDAALLEMLTQAELMNYLELMPALSGLTEKGSLTCSREGTVRRYALTDEGKETLDMYRGRILDSDLKKLDSLAPLWQEKLRVRRDYRADMAQTERGDYRVTLSLMERGEPSLTLEMRVPSSGIADRLVKRWSEAGGEVYRGLIEPLLGKDEQ